MLILKRYHQRYYVLKHKELEIYYNETSPEFYRKEEWSEKDEQYYPIEHAASFDITRIGEIQGFLKYQKNIRKYFEIVEVNKNSLVGYGMKKV